MTAEAQQNVGEYSVEGLNMDEGFEFSVVGPESESGRAA